jgi:iron complex outermembrane receptor protein
MPTAATERTASTPCLSTLAAALLLTGLAPLPAGAQEAVTTPGVQITGSRLLRAQAEGPSPVTVIKGDDIERLGYKNVFDALSGLTQNTGFTQGEDFGNTFTPAANAISLRSLGPNHTLTLINGRRVADYPTAYDGSVNFVNLANIPSALIDRIEILDGGASAIYGSDAIAGVVNIILKKQLDGVHLNLKAGTTQQGGGENLRVQLSGGIASDAVTGVWGLELGKRQPIWSRQRDFMADTTLAGAAPTAIASRRNADTGAYVDPAAGCDALAGLFDGSTTHYQLGSRNYCASGRAQPTYWTTQTGNQTANLAGLFDIALTPKTTLFAEVLLGVAKTENNTRGPSWTSLGASSGYFRNANTGDLETWTRRLAPEELGGVTRFNREWRDSTGNLALGARGELVDGWNYEVAYNASGYRNKTVTPRLLASVDTFFLGPQQGTDADGIPVYAPDPARLYTPLTSAEYGAISGASEGDNRSWNHGLSASVRGELLSLPAGPLQLAAVAEIGSQGFSNRADARLGQGVFYNTKEVAEVKGTRQRQALGAELNAPLSRQLTATLAGRYDDYAFAGRHDDKLTWQAGLEFRPSRELLLRANHATSFRAPDMSYIYTAESRGYYASSTDYLRCAQAGQPVATCEFSNVSPGFNYVSNGSADLKSENGRSWGLGAFWSPSAQFEASIDFWKIEIDNLVTTLDADKLLRDEADCRSGARDPASPSCLDTFSRVRRNPANAVVRPGEVYEIAVNPINAAQESTRGFDLGVRYRWATEGWGRWQVGAKYTRVQSFTYQQFAGDPAINQIGTRDFAGFPTKLVATLDGSFGVWGATLTSSRFGRIADGDEGFVPPQWLHNLSGSHQFGKTTRLTLIVNNVANKTVRDDTGGWPFYPVGFYSAHGRQGWVEFEHRFGGS